MVASIHLRLFFPDQTIVTCHNKYISLSGVCSHQVVISHCITLSLFGVSMVLALLGRESAGKIRNAAHITSSIVLSVQLPSNIPYIKCPSDHRIRLTQLQVQQRTDLLLLEQALHVALP